MLHMNDNSLLDSEGIRKDVSSQVKRFLSEIPNMAYVLMLLPNGNVLTFFEDFEASMLLEFEFSGSELVKYHLDVSNGKHEESILTYIETLRKLKEFYKKSRKFHLMQSRPAFKVYAGMRR